MTKTNPIYCWNIVAFDDKVLLETDSHNMHLKTYAISIQAKTRTANTSLITKRIKKIWLESSNITPLNEVMEVSTTSAFYAIIKDNSYLLFITRCNETDMYNGIATFLGLISQNVFTIKAEDDDGNVYKFKTAFDTSNPLSAMNAINGLIFQLVDL